MVGLREVPRTAAFTWSPGPAPPFLATGTKAGAVDEGFSNDTQLELWDLNLGGHSHSHDLEPAASVETDSRFNDIAWTREQDSESRGVIAGALENGSLDLWDADKLIAKDESAFLSRTQKHSGSIKALQFNAFRSGLLATVGAKGELFISDLNNIGSPFRMGNAVARADDFECLDWNKKSAHIMVTGSSGGTMTVWDIKNKRESLTLNNLGRKPVSAVAWDPNKATRLITATPANTDPVILVWDLRNANAPERVLKGHDSGVLSLAWCQQDPDLLLSCGKDNRNICWNPQTGEAYGEFPVVTNWTFQTRWNPSNPNFIATASFDGKVSINSVQNTKSDSESSTGAQADATDDDDFFNRAQSQPQGARFNLPNAPKWLQRPCGANFGFGGKVVSFRTNSSDGPKRSLVKISTYAADESISGSAELFEKALKENDLEAICNKRINEASNGGNADDWKVIKALTSDNTRKDLVDYLGFSDVDDQPESNISGGATNGDQKSSGTKDDTFKAPVDKSNRLSAFFDNSADGDNFLTELAAAKGARTNNPFQLYPGTESASDRQITHALLLGKFDKALEVCLREGRMSDAFMIAICGGQTCIEKAQKAYFNQKDNGPNYLRLLASVVGKNLWDLVHNADLGSWRDVMATLCTYADTKDFPDLCETLGDRLEEKAHLEGGNSDARKEATFCFLAGSKLEKVVSIWIAAMEESEHANSLDSKQGTTFSVHVHALQDFIEKVTVFREVTSYRDDDQASQGNWKLSALYDKYIEYADIASSHGHLEIAERYLDLLPDSYSISQVAKNRVKQATRKVAPQTPAKQQTPSKQPIAGNNRIPDRGMPPMPDYSQRAAPRGPPLNKETPYTPAAPPSISSPYQPAAGQPQTTAYMPQAQQYGQTRGQPGLVPPPAYGPPSQQPSFGAPPRNLNASPSIPPPSKAANMGNWNDTPDDFFKSPGSRRGTPSTFVGPPSAYQPAQPPPTGNTFAPPPRSTPPLGPPPKGSLTAPPRVTSPPTNMYQPPQQSQAPSASTNAYAPPQSSLPVQQLPTIPRGPSPYNAPPSQPPPSNRYAPAQAPQSELPSQSNIRPRPPPPPANPYAPQSVPDAVSQQAPPMAPPPNSLNARAGAQAQETPKPNPPQSQRKQSSAAPPKHRESRMIDSIR